MSKIIGTVYNVQRVPKTATATNVGDFQTLEEAKTAMLEHFKKTPKRGSFFYRISEAELEDFDGVIMRKFCLVLSVGNGSYYKLFSMEELKALATQESTND